MAKRLSFFIFICMMLSFTAVFGQEAAQSAADSAVVASQQQNTETGPVNEFFRSDSKIYVAVGLLVIIFTSIVLYLVRLDRRIGRLEKDK